MSKLRQLFGRTDSSPDGDTEVFRHAALTALHPKMIGLNRVAVEIGSVSIDDVRRERVRIAELKQWIATLTDARFRAAYEYWLDYYERGANEAEQALAEDARGQWKKECALDRAERNDMVSRAKDAGMPSVPTLSLGKYR